MIARRTRERIVTLTQADHRAGQNGASYMNASIAAIFQVHYGEVMMGRNAEFPPQVVIEHVISSLKRCRLVKDTLRLWKAGVRDPVMEICCGLYNLRLRLALRPVSWV